jgi:hypothetical protein
MHKQLKRCFLHGTVFSFISFVMQYEFTHVFMLDNVCFFTGAEAKKRIFQLLDRLVKITLSAYNSKWRLKTNLPDPTVVFGPIPLPPDNKTVTTTQGDERIR